MNKIILLYYDIDEIDYYLKQNNNLIILNKNKFKYMKNLFKFIEFKSIRFISYIN